LLVKKLLEDRGLEVQALIGAPSVAGRGELRGIQAASRLDVLDLLTRGGFDLMHYSGHGDFDPESPDRVGWIFEGGLLTSGELSQMELAPRLIVANACLSARSSNRLQRGKRSSDRRSEADLLPSLADEFFRRGVRNYVGTAWEVSDAGAVEFARKLYEALLPGTRGESGETIGNAVLLARQDLHERWNEFDALWAAYQHYGDPEERLSSARA
jgi:CHAT domain-containing protein